MAAILAHSQHIGLCKPAATLLVAVSSNAPVLYHADPVGQDMAYSQVCRLNSQTILDINSA
jgi:hypothetical protein